MSDRENDRKWRDASPLDALGLDPGTWDGGPLAGVANELGALLDGVSPNTERIESALESADLPSLEGTDPDVSAVPGAAALPGDADAVLEAADGAATVAVESTGETASVVVDTGGEAVEVALENGGEEAAEVVAEVVLASLEGV